MGVGRRSGLPPVFNVMPYIPTQREHRTLSELLAANAAEFCSDIALHLEDGSSLTWDQLQGRVLNLARVLGSLGLGRNDRVAMSLPQGSTLALSFLAVASCTTAAPLNPAYLEKDCLFYLEDLGARACLLMEGVDGPARIAAGKLKIPVVEVARGQGGKLEFRVKESSPTSSGEVLPSEPADVALVLHTSGTTSRPKQVPLSQGNLMASARHVGAALQLGRNDRCLNVMPLFHIHGLVAGLLAPLASGGSTVCTPTFEATSFLEWLERWQPTWFTCVPTMHQAILGAVDSRQAPLARRSLRFIRSSSAALPPTVMSRLEAVFGVPVIESYGMTEAAHQMASNPLPPRTRKPGSVGLAAGPEIVILDDSGQRLGAGVTGEIAIRGPNVTSGYVNHPTATAAAFTHGWFRTGDQGYQDDEGYLFITGRLKEMINRGGEKVAPREVDEVLLTYPGVRQAVAFAVPHGSLGEDMAAAVVVEVGATLDEAALRDFALERLPAFKVPTRIVFVPEIPKGATGKVQRIGLFERLAARFEVGFEPPLSPMEHQIVDFFCQTLKRTDLGRRHNFFAMGGDSLGAARIAARLTESLGIEVSPAAVFRFPTAAHLSKHLEEIVAPEVEALASELEGLSPEEQARLLEGLS